MGRKVKNLVGQRFSRWVVLSQGRTQRFKNGGQCIYWRAECDCGNIKEVSGDLLKYEKSKQCKDCQLRDLPKTRATVKMRKCQECGKDIESRTPNQRFCSEHDVLSPEYEKVYVRSAYLRKKDAAYDALGEICKVCGFGDRRALNIDHIYGGGTQDRVKNSNYAAFYVDVVKNPDKYQILCCNHNWIKRIENGEVKVHEFTTAVKGRLDKSHQEQQIAASV